MDGRPGKKGARGRKMHTLPGISTIPPPHLVGSDDHLLHSLTTARICPALSDSTSGEVNQTDPAIIPPSSLPFLLSILPSAFPISLVLCLELIFRGSLVCFSFPFFHLYQPLSIPLSFYSSSPSFLPIVLLLSLLPLLTSLPSLSHPCFYPLYPLW